MKAEVKIPRGWRRLNPEEEIKKGDRYIDFSKEAWLHSTTGIGLLPGHLNPSIYIRKAGEARSAPERSEGSKPSEADFDSEGKYDPSRMPPERSLEGLAPAREWVLMVESETGHIACGWKEWPKGVHSEPMSGCKYIRVREVLPVSPSLEAPKASEADWDSVFEAMQAGHERSIKKQWPLYQRAHEAYRRLRNASQDPAPAVQGAPTEAGMSHEVRDGLRLILRSYIYTNHGAIGAAKEWIESILSAQRGEGGEKKPTPEAGGAQDGEADLVALVHAYGESIRDFHTDPKGLRGSCAGNVMKAEADLIAALGRLRSHPHEVRP